MIINPVLIYQNSKKIFSQNVSTLSMTIKLFLLLLVAVFFIDNILGISQNMIVNSKIDTLKHLSEISNKQYVEDCNALSQEVVNSKTIFAKTVDSFSFYMDEDNRVPVINTLTVAIIPIVLFIILLFHIVLGIAIKRVEQLERLLNMILLLAFAFGLFHFMLSISYMIPTFPEGFLWGNYVVNLFLSLVLFLLICEVITCLYEKLEEIPASHVEAPAIAGGHQNQEVVNVQLEEQ